MSEEAASKPQGILSRTTTEDLGLVNLPVLTPHLRFQDIGDHQTLLVSESFNTLLHGKLYSDVIPLLDGSNTFDDIVRACGSVHGFADILSAIVSLSTKGYVISADHSLDQSRAAYWSSLGATPRWVEQTLEQSRISVSENGTVLKRNLEQSGVGIVDSKPHLTVIVCEDYLSNSLAEVNRRQLASKTPWMLVRPWGIEPLFGPVFHADGTGPCWACLSHRLRSHQEVHEFLRHMGGEQATYKPFAAENQVLQGICALASSEIVKWLVLGDKAPIDRHAVAMNMATLAISHHFVMRRPQCSECGDKELKSPDRPPVPICLNERNVTCRNSGGSRSVTPDVTLAKYRHLVSPISGVVSWLSRTTQENDPWLHVYWAGSNFGMRSRSLSSLRRSLRSKSAGKGSTKEQSEVSALCEAIERYSGSVQGSEIRKKCRFSDLSEGNGAIHPNDVQLFSDLQLDNAEELNSQGHPYNFVPPKLDLDAEIDWTPVWSLSDQRHRYLPTSLLYTMAAESRGPFDLVADSNGCASGNSLEEAILQGFYELVERDAFAIWWYNRLEVPAVDLASFDDEYLSTASDYYSRLEREVWILDITADIEIPSFVAISHRPNSPREEIIYGAGTHPDSRIAALRSVCELNQCLSWLPGRERRPGLPMIDDPMALSWWKNARLADCAWLTPSRTDPTRLAADYVVDESDDMKREVEKCQAMVEAKGMEFLVLDQTRPDVGMPVVRVIVPGMRHFWARFAPGRLFDVPVDVGRVDNPLHESDLNPIPVIA